MSLAQPEGARRMWPIITNRPGCQNHQYPQRNHSDEHWGGPSQTATLLNDFSHLITRNSHHLAHGRLRLERALQAGEDGGGEAVIPPYLNLFVCPNSPAVSP